MIMKIATTHWEYGVKLMKLSFLIPNPPVPAVANEVMVLSRKPIPPNIKRMTSIPVRKK